MTARFSIKDPSNGKVARVLNGGALEVLDIGIPPQGLKQRAILYRDFFTDSASSNDMTIDGSTTPVEFTINAPTEETTDRYITNISFLIEDSNMRLGDRFGGITGGLTNGVDVEYTNNVAEGGVVSLSLSGILTNFDLIRLCLGNPAFGDGTTAFQAEFRGSASAYLPALEFTKYGLTYGVLLRGGTDDKIVIRINDDLTSITTFNAVAAGFDRIETTGA